MRALFAAVLPAATGAGEAQAQIADSRYCATAAATPPTTSASS